MGVIYTKTASAGNQNFLALSPREALAFPFPFGSDWTKIRIGMMIGYTSLTSPNASLDGFGTATLNPAVTERDRLFYGIKKMGNSFPREDNQPFVGFKSYGAQTSIDFPITLFDHRNFHGSEIHLGVHHPNNSKEGHHFNVSLNAGYNMVNPSSANNSTGTFAGFPILALDVVNKGQANQKLRVRWGQTQVGDNSLAASRFAVLNTSLTDYGELEFNNSGCPYELPDSFFIHNPIPSIRTRIFALIAVREA